MTDETTTTKKAGLSPIEVGAGAGAAVIAAFASSYLGTAGTLTGAAVASMVGTVSTSVLRNSAHTGAERLKHTTTRLRDTGVERTHATDVRPVESEDVDPYGPQLFGAPNWIDPDPQAGSDPGLTGPTGVDPGSAWPEPNQHLSGPGSDGSGAGRPYRPGAPGPAPRVTGPGAGIPGSWPDAEPAEPAAGATGPVTGGRPPIEATRPLTRQTGPGMAGAPGETGPGQAGPGGDSAGRIGLGLRRVRSRWVVVGAGAVAAFAVALGAITGIEAAAGKPLSGLAGQESGGGTTIGRATGGDGGTGSTAPSPTPTPTTSGGATSTAPAPSNGPTVSPTAPSNPPASSPAPSPSQPAPTQAPTPAPSAPSQQTP